MEVRGGRFSNDWKIHSQPRSTAAARQARGGVGGRGMHSMAYARWIFAVGFCAAAATAQAGLFSRPAADYRRDVKPLIDRHCTSCHGEKKPKSGLSFDAFQNESDVRRNWRTWLNVAQRLEAGDMPPEEKPQPSAAERRLILDWLARDMFPVDPDRPDPGRVTIRRLNRSEYNNTIRDLLGVDFRPADDFPADDLGYGFDNIGDALTVSPLLLEKYIAAAEQALDRAIVSGGPSWPARKFPADAMKAEGGGESRGDALVLFSTGEAVVRPEIAKEGEYRIRVSAFAQQAGNEPARMTLKLDGRDVQTFDVKAEENAPEKYEFKTKLTAGPRRIAAAFVNDFYDPQNRNPRRRDRNLFIESIVLEGPLDTPPPAPQETHRRIFTVMPDATHTTNDCLHAILAGFTRRAYRRPAATDEVNALAGFAQRTLAEGATFEAAVQAALTAVLVSPHFLYRGEFAKPADRSRGVQEIDEFSLASRLSYFLWSSMPDEELFRLAETGKLRANLDAQAGRMIKDRKAQAFVENFPGQWLQTRNLEIMTPDKALYPGFDEELRAAMRRETELFFADILGNDRSVIDFVGADYTFVNERLAQFYGIAGVTGPDFRRVSAAQARRGGVLTQASILTLTSNPTRTSPVKRGKWVMENIMNTPPSPPPANVPPFQEKSAAEAEASLRDRMTEHRSDPVCSSCHVQMDAIGFAFEHFDGVGRWREKDGRFAIDDSCELNNGDQFDGAAGLKELMAGKRSDQFVRCLTEKLLTYALGRGMEYYDMPTVERIARASAKQNHRFSALIREVVKSSPFQTRRAESGEVAKR